MSGTDLLETMRDDQQLQPVPFLLVSSETRFRYLDPIRQAGAIAILPKPFNQNELSVALKTTLDHLNPKHLHLDELDIEMVEILIVAVLPVTALFR